MALSTKPLGGMRQRYPEEFRTERYVTDLLRAASLRAGFQEYDGPVMEPLALFAAKSGGELVERQSYSFADRSGRDVILRPEMTPSLARMVSGRGELQLPARWFSMPLCYRYERPQRGRVREFLQYNCDILGSGSLASELEIILVLQDIMRTAGADPSIYRIGWSSRRFMTRALALSGVEDAMIQTVFSAIDKRDKMKEEDWAEHILQVCGGAEKTAEAIERLVNVSSVSDEWLAGLMGQCEAYEEVVAFSGLLNQVGADSAVFSPGVVRGLDYYTGIVFELMDTGGENRRALCGGGRYDNLTSLFTGKGISGVGFGMGVLTLTLFLETYGLIPDSVEDESPADLFIAVFSPEVIGPAGRMASRLRREGFRVIMDVSGKKLGRQFAEASRLNVPAVLTVGPEEVEKGIYQLKILADGSVFPVAPDEIASHLK